MEKRYRKGIAAALVVVSVYFFLVQAARYNLAAMAVAAAEDAAAVIVDAGHGGEDGDRAAPGASFGPVRLPGGDDPPHRYRGLF